MATERNLPVDWADFIIKNALKLLSRAQSILQEKKNKLYKKNDQFTDGVNQNKIINNSLAAETVHKANTEKLALPT